MVYKPLLSLETSKVVGFEALPRCHHPSLVLSLLSILFPHAEQSGRIIELGDWIFQQTLLDLKRIHKNGLEGICISINVSLYKLNRESCLNA